MNASTTSAVAIGRCAHRRCAGAGLGGSLSAFAQQGLDEPFREAFNEALAGKTVAYVPVAMNFDLAQGWFAGVKKELEPFGVKFEMRDPELEHQCRRPGGDHADLARSRRSW